MGTKILSVIAFVAIAAAAGWNYQQNTNEVQLSDLALENAEALARGESGTDYCDDFTTMRCMLAELFGWICIISGNQIIKSVPE